jgi:hypothetical protein
MNQTVAGESSGFRVQVESNIMHCLGDEEAFEWIVRGLQELLNISNGSKDDARNCRSELHLQTFQSDSPGPKFARVGGAW